MVIKNKKGYLRLIEMSFAAALIIAFLIFVQQTQSTIFKNPPKYDAVVLKQLGQDALRGLDLRDNETNYRSDLRERLNCDATTWTKLIEDLSFYLPANVGFSLYSVDINGISAYKGGRSQTSEPQRSEIVAVNYIVAGEYGNYSNFDNPCIIKILLWFNL